MTIRLPQPGRTFDDVCTELESNTSGSYPVGVNGMPHQGVHIPGPGPVHAIASGTLIAYRLRKRLQEMRLPGYEHKKPPILSDSFALLKHDYVTPKGAQLSYYSLYMNLLPWGEEGHGEEVPVPSALPVMTPEERLLSLFGARHYTVATEGLPGETDWQELQQSGPPVRGLVVYESSQPDATAVSFLEHGATVPFKEPLAAHEALKNPSGKPLELAGGGFIRPQAGDIEARPLIPHRVCDAVQNVSIPIEAGTLIGYPSPGHGGDYVHLGVMVLDLTTLDSHKDTWGQKVPPHLPPGSSYDATSWFTQVKESMEPWTRVAVDGLLASLGIEVPKDIVQIGQALEYEPAIGTTLRKVITHARSEWDVATQTGLPALLEKDYKMPEAAAKVYAEFVRAMSFLQEVNPPLPATTHHVHPITHIKKVKDLRGITRDQLYEIVHHYWPRHLRGVAAALHARLEQLLLPLNHMMEHYEINASRERQCHFLAQVMVECAYLAELAELSKASPEFQAASRKLETESSFYDKPDPHFATYYQTRAEPFGNLDFSDAVKFRGRGLLQVTGRDHYADYWVYKKWLAEKDFTPFWWSHIHNPADGGCKHFPREGTIDQQSAFMQTLWTPAQTQPWVLSKTQSVSAADIPDPQKLSIDPKLACDSAGWFWAVKNNLNTVVDEHYGHDIPRDKHYGYKPVHGHYPHHSKPIERKHWDNHVVKRITRVINGAEHPQTVQRRQHAYHQIKKILMPDS